MRRTILLLAATALAVLLSSGVALALNTINCKTNQACTGTKRADLMKGTNRFDDMSGRGGNDTLKGFGKWDFLLGQKGNDKLLGGRGGDWVVGGRGDDTLRGEGGFDGYSFEGSDWGQDVIIEETSSIDYLALPVDENFTGPVTTDLNSGAGPEVEVTNTQSSSTVNWEGDVIAYVLGSSGNDTITGNDAYNEIWDDAGPFWGTAPDTDVITSAGGGDDFILVQDGDTNDSVNCGEGDDFVVSDEGEEALIAPDCEENDTTPVEVIIDSEAKAAGAQSAPGGDLSKFRSFQARAQTD